MTNMGIATVHLIIQDDSRLRDHDLAAPILIDCRSEGDREASVVGSRKMGRAGTMQLSA